MSALHSRRRALGAVVGLILTIIGCGHARADDARADDWDPARAEVRPAEVAVLPVLGAGLLTVGLTAKGSPTPSWIGRNGFDDGARSFFRAPSRGMRNFSAITSDVLFVGMTLYPVVIDMFLLAGVAHRRWDVALRIAVTYGQSALAAGVLAVGSQGYVGRGRPLTEECALDPSYDGACGTNQVSRSFFAGHPAAVFNAAGQICQDQVDWPLYGTRAGGIVACASAMTLGGVTGVLRLVADKHWASDVLVGSGVGAATGLLTPLVARALNRKSGTSLTLVPAFGDVYGLTTAGSF